MTPIVEVLLAYGLGLLANATAAKGDAWLKEQTKVDVTKPVLSQEDLVVLKQYEAANEDALLKIRLDTDRLNLNELTIRLADTSSARQRELDLEKTNAQSLAKLTPTILALGATLFVLCTLALFVVFGKLDVGGKPILDRDILLYVAGVFSAILSQIFNYYFGSSSGSKEKSQTLDSVIEKIGRSS
jgi:hypothetical protein